MPRDLSKIPPAKLLTALRDFHDLSGIWTSQLPTTAVYSPIVKTVNGHIYINESLGVNFANRWLFKKDGTLTPVCVADGAASTFGVHVHSDMLLKRSNGSAIYAMNLRQDGEPRNINGAAGLPGVIAYSPNTTVSSVVYGEVSLTNLAVPAFNSCEHYSDDRYLVGVSTENTTYYGNGSQLENPDTAPICTPSTSGGTLVAGDYDVAFAFVTRCNTRMTGQGITEPSPAHEAVTIASGSTGSISVPIPGAPTGATAYVVYAAEAGQPLRVVGGGIAKAGGVTHTVKQTMAGLGMHDRFFATSSSQFQQIQVTGSLESANPLTLKTARNYTNYFNQVIWSPFFKDPTKIHIVVGSPISLQTSLKADVYDIQADSTLSNDSMTADGQPAFVSYVTNNRPNNYVYWRSIPEIMAYAIGGYGSKGFGVSAAGNVPFVQIRSCMTNEILTNYSFYDVAPYYHGGMPSGSYNLGTSDFESAPEDAGLATKAVDILMSSILHRGIIRQPVGWRS